MPNVFTNPERLPQVAPSILSADFGHMVDECRAVLEAGADVLHVDVMDGHFVPNLTMGPDMVRGIRRALPEPFLDVHLMVTDPEPFFAPFIDAGAGHVSFHVEVAPGDEAKRLCDRIRSLGATAGVAINPPTPDERILEVAVHADLVLVMGVNPGFSGQPFIESSLETIRAVSAVLRVDQRLEVDGGVGPSTVERIRDAGGDVLVGGSAIFGRPPDKRAEAIRAFRG